MTQRGPLLLVALGWTVLPYSSRRVVDMAWSWRPDSREYQLLWVWGSGPSGGVRGTWSCAGAAPFGKAIKMIITREPLYRLEHGWAAAAGSGQRAAGLRLEIPIFETFRKISHPSDSTGLRIDAYRSIVVNTR